MKMTWQDLQNLVKILEHIFEGQFALCYIFLYIRHPVHLYPTLDAAIVSGKAKTNPLAPRISSSISDF